MTDYNLKIIELDMTGSTNDYTKALDSSVYDVAEDSKRRAAAVPDGAACAGSRMDASGRMSDSSCMSGTRPVLVTALGQTAGRGRYGRSFHSPRGTGIYMTYSFRPRFSPEDSIQSTLVTAAVVHKVLSEYTDDPLVIKWVNDIYRNKRKIVGILVEGVPAASGAFDRLVIGIGINLFPSPVPEDLAGKVGFLLDGAPDSDVHTCSAYPEDCPPAAEQSEAAAERVRQSIISAVAAGLNEAFISGGYDPSEYIAYYKRFCYNYPGDL